MASSTFFVTVMVSASGNFWITRNSVGVASTASPMRGWWSSMTCVTSPSRMGVLVPSIETWPRLSAVVIGSTCWTARRWFLPSMNPPVPGVDASTKVSGETHSALPAVSMTWVRVTSLPRSFEGSTCTWSCRSRSP